MLQICSQKHLMLAYFNIRLQVLECLTSEVLIDGRLIVLICRGLYMNDNWNGMQNLLRMKLVHKLTAAGENTVKAKTVNGEVQLQALVDKKKVIITESTIRRDLQLEDANGVDSLPNATIFEELTRMGIYVTPSHTKKIFGNMKREGKCFSKRVTPLFQTMMVQAHEEMGEGSKIPTDPHHTPIITQSSITQTSRKQKLGSPEKEHKVPQPSGCTDNVQDENIPTTSNDPLLSGEDRLKLTELIDLCTNLQKKVLDLEKAKTTQDSEIVSLKKKVKKLERRNKSRL
ncbi:hypothetical protein Tco_0729074 [Tanacetum coccineum]|uniref:Uncharacterized protein n=1 Tax=Tanacetum coccineum TaxID=301880 RepID=A0ABQ4YRD5_9ASTR